jgi:hypothetical protein
VRWSRLNSGLFVPEPVDVNRIPANSLAGRRGIAIQAICAVVTALLSSVALIVSVYTLRQQQGVNLSQVEVNKIEQERFDRRYASRVSWWLSEDYRSLQIQNRAPIPLTRIAIYVDVEWERKSLGDGWFWLPTLPPCTELRLSIPERLEVINQLNGVSYYGRIDHYSIETRSIETKIRFSDGHHTWIKELDSLSLDAMQNSLATPASNIASQSESRPLGDCGEGG